MSRARLARAVKSKAGSVQGAPTAGAPGFNFRRPAEQFIDAGEKKTREGDARCVSRVRVSARPGQPGGTRGVINSNDE